MEKETEVRTLIVCPECGNPLLSKWKGQQFRCINPDCKVTIVPKDNVRIADVKVRSK